MVIALDAYYTTTNRQCRPIIPISDLNGQEYRQTLCIGPEAMEQAKDAGKPLQVDIRNFKG